MSRRREQLTSPEGGDQAEARIITRLDELGHAAPLREGFVPELEARLLVQARALPAADGVVAVARRAARRTWHLFAIGANRLAVGAILAVAVLALVMTVRGAAVAIAAGQPADPLAGAVAVPTPELGALPTAVPAADGAAPVVVARLQGAIDPVSARYLHRVVEEAEVRRATALVILIDTPGGLDSSMRQMVQDLLNSPVPTIVFAAPAGARDASAGVFITQAATLAAMAPGTSIGAAHPVNGDGSNIASDERDKVTNDAAAYIVSLARQRGHNQQWAESAVRESVALDAEQALAQNVVNFVAPDLPALLSQVNGRAVTTTAGSVTLRTAGAPLVRVEMHPIERLFQAIVDPTVAFLLMTIGFFAILIELFHPGALAPGVTGVICLILAFVAFAALPLNWGGVLLILAAIALFVVDVKATTHGALTVAGLACFIIGALLLYTPPGPRSPALPTASVALPVLLTMAALVAGLSLTVVGAAVRLRRQPALIAWSPVAGALGTTSTTLEPEGVVRVSGQLWSARLLGGTLGPDEPVRVRGRTGLTLEVEPAEPGGTRGEEEFPYVQ